MQFTHPELLWALFLLLIPLIVHLFQLRRFHKTPFTNVRLLKKVAAKSRRSRNLKKWLLLLIRCLLIAALVLSFSQPYIAGPEAFINKQLVIYLDNSFSMQAKTKEGSLLENAIQELQKVIPEEQVFSLFTNDRVYEQVHIRDIQNELLSIPYTEKQLPLQAVILKASNLFSPDTRTIENLVVISDFQAQMREPAVDTLSGMQKYMIQLGVANPENASVDSAYISKKTPTTLELTANLSSNVPMDAVPVSLFNGDTLIAKTAAQWDSDQKARVLFSLPANQPINGRIEITDNQLSYDNQLFFTIEKKVKIGVLSVGADTDLHLDRIFTEPEFDYHSVAMKNLNYSSLSGQNLIILNELPTIPQALQNTMDAFIKNGGSMVLIPASDSDIGNYNQLLRALSAGSFREMITGKQAITGISFSHPLFANVFEDEISNFQYPSVAEFFRLATTEPTVLSFQGGAPFLAGINGIYLFTAPLSGISSNFRNSPLIVPTFYNMGVQSLKLPQLYFQTDRKTEVDISVTLGNDRILEVRQGDYEFIPMQRSYSNKTTLIFNENPDRDGQFVITEEQVPLKHLSFNYGRDESILRYMVPDSLHADTVTDDLTALFNKLENAASITALWKWFVILALLCMFSELIIQKFLK